MSTVLQEISRGAESIVYRARVLGIDVVVKYREPKRYMDPRLDLLIRSRRTLTEARVIRYLRERGVEVPALIYTDPEESLLVIEYIEGETLRDYLSRGGDVGALEKAGEILGKIHYNGVFHGDPTISNYIVDRRSRIWIIDFGLSGFGTDIEERAVDLHLAYRSIETLPLRDIDYLKRVFFEGYKRAFPEAERVAERVEEIRRMGRYVAERRARGVYRF